MKHLHNSLLHIRLRFFKIILPKIRLQLLKFMIFMIYVFPQQNVYILNKSHNLLYLLHFSKICSNQ